MGVLDDFRNGKSLAIPTKFNGIEYQSGFEARTARFLHTWFGGFPGDFDRESGLWRPAFDRSGIYEDQSRIEHEPESFLLDDGRRYTPDFRVLRWREGGSCPIYVECRGYESPETNNRLEVFGQHCVTNKWIFLILWWTRVELYARIWGPKRQAPFSEVWFYQCPACHRNTLGIFEWEQPSRQTVWGSRIYRPGDTEWLIPTVVSGCHSCSAMWSHNIFSGPCFQVEMKEGSIEIDEWVAMMVSHKTFLAEGLD